MDQDFSDYAFCVEVISAAESCIAAGNRLAALQRLHDQIGIYECLVSILHNTTRVALVFWPSNKGADSKDWRRRKEALLRENRGRRMREVINLDDEDSFIKDRKFRNSIAHIDERIDKWLSTSPRSSVRFNIGPRDGFGGVSDEDLFEHFDPSTGILYFHGDTFDVRRSMQCVVRIREKTQRYLNFLHR